MSEGLPVDTATLTEWLLALASRLRGATAGVTLKPGKIADHLTDAAAALSALDERLGEAQRQEVLLRDCDCIGSPVSSASCPKCGRRGIITESAFIEWATKVNNADAAEARAVDAEAREKALIEALEEIEALWNKDPVYARNKAHDFARAALAGVRGQGKEGQELEAGALQSRPSGGGS